ncbi:MAG: peptide deformylase [Burkholderiaceae bacterium]
MAIREILRMGDARLRRVAEPVQAFGTRELQSLLNDMRETMVAANGAGLAAPQIGVNLQVVIFGTGEVSPRYPQEPAIPPTVLINPRITPMGDAQSEGWEGCLSVPGLRGVVPRWSEVRYTGFDETGTPIDRAVSGFHARVVQHEVDHLLGVLYPQRMRDFTRFGFTDILFPELSAASDDD